jgi:hypothetical protein
MMRRTPYLIWALGFLPALTGLSRDTEKGLRETSPPEWTALGFPSVIDRSQNPSKELNEFINSAREKLWRTNRSTSGSDREIATYLAIYRHFLTPVPGEHENFRYKMLFSVEIFANVPEAIELAPLLRPSLQHPEEAVRTWIAMELAMIGDKESVPDILPLLLSRNPDTVHVAKKALRMLGYELPFEDEKPQRLPGK